MVLLQLCRWKFSHKNSVADWTWILFTKSTNSLYEPPFGGVIVTYALYLQLVGKHVIDFLFAITEHFSLALYSSDVISRYWSKSAFFNGMNHFKRKFQVEWDIALPIVVGIRKQRVITFHVVSKYRQYVLLSQRTPVTERQTHGRRDRITIPKTALA